MTNKLFFTAIFLLLAQATFAQRTITGQVTSVEDNLSMPGVSVVIKGTTTGTATDNNGNFSLNVPNNDAIIVVSFLGFRTVEMPLGTQARFDIMLEPDVFALDDVVVTATRTPHSVYAVPANISVINKKLIEESPIVFTDEALRSISGVYVKRSKLGDQTTAVGLRGFSGGARSLVLLDGIPLNDGYNQGITWGAIPTDAIAKVEVVKGSFSSLYGGNAMGGVVNILTEIPREESFTIKTNYGTYNTFNSSASYSNRLLKSKKLGVFFSAGQITSDGYASNLYQTTAREVTSVTGTQVTGWQKTTNNRGVDYFLLGDVGENWMKQMQLYGKLSYEINRNSTLDFSVSAANNSYGYRKNKTFLLDESTNRPVNSGAITLNDNGVLRTITVSPNSFLSGGGEGTTSSYKLSYKTKINNVSLSAYVGLLNDPSRYITVSSGATQDGGPGYSSETKPKRTYIASVQADFPVLGNHYLTVGADYKLLQAANEEWNLSSWRDYDTQTTFRSSMEGKQGIIAPFLQAEINIAEGLKSYIGARYDHWNNSDGKNSEGTSDTIYAGTSTGHFSPKAGLVYTPEMYGDIFKIKSVRASVGESFRTPTIYNLYRTWASSTTTYYSNPELKPESALSWELGIALSLFNDRTKISFDYYQSYIKDLLYSSEIATGFRKQMNAAKGEIKGFEVELRQNIFSFMDVFFNLTSMNTEITENTAEPQSIGKKFTNVPHLLYNIGANFYKGPVNLMLTYNFTDKVYSASDNTDTFQGVYGSYDEQRLLDGRISYKIKNVSLSLSVNNILDKEYFIYYIAPGRTYNVGITAKF